jgi:hypothetical protein
MGFSGEFEKKGLVNLSTGLHQVFILACSVIAIGEYHFRKKPSTGL